jgi:ABC-type dipeptide/oligopeptide/nickel transport system permease subunit
MTLAQAPIPARQRPWWTGPSFLLGAALTGLIVGMALISWFWTPYPPTQMMILNRLKPPSGANWFGTDQFGRDVFSMIMVGARNSLAVGLGAVGFGMIVGTTLGLLAAIRRDGWLDNLIMRTADFTHAFPAVLTAIMITAIAGPGMLNAVVAIGVLNLPYFARLARGAALQIWTQDYIQAGGLQVSITGRSRGAMCSPILPGFWWCRRRSNLRSPYWPKPGCPISDWARSRPIPPGGACSTRRRRSWRCSPGSLCFRALRSR